MQLTTCTVDLTTGRVDHEGRVEQLTDLERKLFSYLAARPHQDIPQDELLAEVWGYAEGVVSRAVAAAMRRLRNKVERNPAAPDHLVTVWGRGFRFEPLVTRHARLLDRFVGREALRRQLVADLDTSHLITLVGPGGIGKTRLAQQLLHDARRPWTWIDAAPARTRADLEHRVRETFGVDEGVDWIVELREGDPFVLVLDNLEEVVEAAASLVPEWLARLSRLTVLCTSREALRITGETVVAVGPLDAEASRTLFVERMPTPPPRGDAIDQVLTLLDGMPLAIELAARLLDVLSVDQLHAELARSLDCLVEDRRDRDERHASVHHVLQRSFDALTVVEQQGLVALALAHGSFDLSAAQALVGPHALRILRALKHKSLVHRDGDRHRLLHPIRAFASAQQTGLDVGQTQRRWQAWLGQRAREHAAGAELGMSGSAAWLRTHRADLVSAWEELLDEAPDRAADLAGALHAFCRDSGAGRSATAYLDRTLAASPSPEARGHLLVLRSGDHDLAGAIEQADADAVEALEIAERSNDAWLEGRAAAALLWTRGETDFRVDDDPLVARAFQAHDRAGDRIGRARTLIAIGSRHWGARRYDQAIDVLRDAVKLWRDVGSVRGEAQTLTVLSGNYVETGAYAEAHRLLDRALQVQRDLNDPLIAAVVGRRKAAAWLIAGDWDQAVAGMADALELSLRAGVGARELATMCQYLGLGHVLRDDLVAAADALAVGRRYANQANYAYPELQLMQAWVQALRGEVAVARDLLAAPPPTSDAGEERLSAVLRGLLLVTVEDAPEARAEAHQILVRAEAELPLDHPSILVKPLVDRLAARLRATLR